MDEKPPAVASAPPPADARRDQILQAAIAVFGEKGFQRTTIKDIAGRAGVAPGTIYLYFKNKRDLLVSIADKLVVERVDEVLSQALRLDIEAGAAAILSERLQFARQNAGLLRALIPEIWTDQELQQILISQVIAPIFAMAQRYLGMQIAAGRLRPVSAEIVVPAFVGGVAAISLMRMTAPERFTQTVSEERVVRELVSLYLHGLRGERGEEPDDQANADSRP